MALPTTTRLMTPAASRRAALNFTFLSPSQSACAQVDTSTEMVFVALPIGLDAETRDQPLIFRSFELLI